MYYVVNMNAAVMRLVAHTYIHQMVKQQAGRHVDTLYDMAVLLLGLIDVYVLVLWLGSLKSMYPLDTWCYA